MEHIIQFAVGIDDNRIVTAVEKNAEEQIINDIEQQVVNKLFQSYYYAKNADPKSDQLSDFSKYIVADMLEKNKDAIIDKSAKYLAEKIAKSKAGREVIEKATTEV